ncbi:hypothetical protein N9164_07345 [Draconibacterium sp.]|nr:hypothetical protein [Draconibacterium sp.]
MKTFKHDPNKSILANMLELAMYCQKKQTADTIKLFDGKEITPEVQQLFDKLYACDKQFMDDCNAVLKLEQEYLNPN